MKWPFPKSDTARAEADGAAGAPEPGLLRGLYRTMVQARCLDEAEARLVARGEAFFHVSGMGHEASAVLSFFLRREDYLHLHYRDKALMLARGLRPADLRRVDFPVQAPHPKGPPT